MSTWAIRGLVLPIEPSKIKKRTIRTQQPVSVVGDFPNPTINQPTRFELQLEGYIWPRSLAQQLDEATKNAETENILVSTTDDITSFWITGIYSVSNSEVFREKPLYDAQTGQEVYEYTITFVKFADAGSVQNSEEGGPVEDESAGFFGFGDTVGFDSNGDGDIDTDELFNWFTNLMTFGAPP